MSETVQSPPAPPVEQQGPTPEQTAILANGTALLASLGSPNAQQRMQKTVEQVLKENPPTQNNNTPPAQNQNTPPAPNQPPAKAPENTPPPTGDDGIIKTDFGHIQVPGAQQPNTPEVKTLEDAFVAMKNDLGFEVKTPQDLLAKKDVIKEWRTKSQKLPEVEGKLKNYETALSSLDPELQVAMKANLEARDWRKEMESFSGTKVNLAKTFESQDPKAMVKALMPKAFTDEELADIDTSSKEFKIAHDAAAQQFGLLKQQRDAAIAQRDVQAREFKKTYDASVGSSMSRLTEVLPGFTDESKKAQLNATLEELLPLAPVLQGTKLGKLLFNGDGTVNTDGATKLAFMEHGSSIMNTLLERAKEQGASKAREDIVSRGQRQPSQAPGHNGNNGNQQQQQNPNQSLLNKIIKGQKHRY